MSFSKNAASENWITHFERELPLVAPQWVLSGEGLVCRKHWVPPHCRGPHYKRDTFCWARYGTFAQAHMFGRRGCLIKNWKYFKYHSYHRYECAYPTRILHKRTCSFLQFLPRMLTLRNRCHYRLHTYNNAMLKK